MRAPGFELAQQQIGDDEIGHVIEGEGHLQPVGGFLPLVEQGAGIVDQDIDLGFARQLARHPLHFRQHRKIGHMHGVVGGRIGLLQRRHGVVGAGFVAGGEDDARALLRQADGGDFADAGGGAGDDDGLALHMKKAPFVRTEPYIICAGFRPGLASSLGHDAAAFGASKRSTGPFARLPIAPHPTISRSRKKNLISLAAVSGASEPWTELASMRFGEFLADGARRGIGGVGRAHHFAVLGDGALAFQHLHHHRAARS